MAVYRTTCPHCHTSNCAFDSAQEWGISGESDRRGLFICGHCSEGIIVKFFPGTGGPLSQIRDLASANIFVIKIWPSLVGSEAPVSTPERPSLYYHQAGESLKSGHFDASGLMFRKCLESSLIALGANNAGSLLKRIDGLAEKGVITDDLKEWAHQIRLGGNEAAHEDEPFSQTDAERLQAFSEAFLRYAFTLPALVSEGIRISAGEAD